MVERVERRARLVRTLGVALLMAVAGLTGGVVTHVVNGGGRSSLATLPVQEPSARPNIVFVLTDDLSSNLVQYMPHLLDLERQGASFRNYTVTDSLCCPSRSSIFTGRFPHNTGVFANGGRDGGFGVFHSRDEESSTYATDLQRAGYRTGLMGKYLNGYEPTGPVNGVHPYVPPGWDEWDVAGSGYNEFDYDLTHDHDVQHYGHAPADYLTDVLGRRASAFITGAAVDRTPFALEVSTFAPHSPFTPAPRDAGRYADLQAPRDPAYDVLPTDPPRWLAGRTPLTVRQQARIDLTFRKRVQSVQAVDKMIGDIESTLQATGTARNTVFVFSSDNGLHVGEYRLMPGKMTAFDTDVVVPLVIAGPGIAHRIVSQPAENIDLRSTLDELAGTSAPGDVDGRSLVPLLRYAGDGGAGGSSPATPPWRTTALVEHRGPDTDPTDPDHPLTEGGNPTTYDALRTTAFTYVQYRNGDREYYDRHTDPFELHNIARTLPPARLAALQRQVALLTRCRGAAGCWAAAGG